MPSAGEDSNRHQVYQMVTTDPGSTIVNTTQNLNNIVRNDNSLSTMSNPLKEMQLSVEKHLSIDKHKPIKIKSIIFDNKG